MNREYRYCVQTPKIQKKKENTKVSQAKIEKLKYVMTIPSVNFLNYVAIDDLMLLGSEDKRYEAMKSQNLVLKQYMESFKTPFGKKVNPSIIVRDKCLSKVNVSHLCAFRNAIAIACVVASRVYLYTQGQIPVFFCTDLFDFYPVSVSSDGTDLVARTAFENSIFCDADNFTGQTTPSVIYPESIRPVLDKEFMLTLLDLIEKKAYTPDEKSFKTRVIRSMEMAYYAMRSPFVTLGERSDFGVQMGLWISAFEILANPHIERVSFSHVSTMIKSVPWKDKKLRIKNRAAIGIKAKKTSLPVQIYGRSYQTRNDYMHGNMMREGVYEPRKRKGWGNLYFQVPALYRCVLLHELNSKGFGELNKNSYEHVLYEKALLSKN
jgi:hypothetical protein